jgi:hypothetical protein
MNNFAVGFEASDSHPGNFVDVSISVVFTGFGEASGAHPE